ncbi:hypothetical protein B0H13DRAFT_2302278 [Mycena leptocephala]|nr:hypothetical protein B0H13DRAFT_2302278 [Mycena leptocephala]
MLGWEPSRSTGANYPFPSYLPWDMRLISMGVCAQLLLATQPTINLHCLLVPTVPSGSMSPTPPHPVDEAPSLVLSPCGVHNVVILLLTGHLISIKRYEHTQPFTSTAFGMKLLRLFYLPEYEHTQPFTSAAFFLCPDGLKWEYEPNSSLPRGMKLLRLFYLPECQTV